MNKRRPPMTLKAHPNVADLAEERRIRERQRAAALANDAVGFQMCFPPDGIVFIGFQAQAPEPATAAQTAPERRPRLRWLRAVLGLVKRSRPP